MADEKKEEPALARWGIQVSPGQARGQVLFNLNVSAPGVQKYEVGLALLSVAFELLKDAGAQLPTNEQAAAAQRTAIIVRDYPAKGLHPGTNALLCAACMDIYATLLEGPIVPLPPGMPPVPCTFHLDESRAPMPIAEATQKAPLDNGQGRPGVETVIREGLVPPEG